MGYEKLFILFFVLDVAIEQCQVLNVDQVTHLLVVDDIEDANLHDQSLLEALRVRVRVVNFVEMVGCTCFFS